MWLSIFSFCLNPNSFINLLIFSEVTWLSLYTYTLVLGVANDELTILSTSFFLLGLASLEFVIGFLLIILFKNFFQSINLVDIEKNWRQYNTNNNSKLYVNRFIWDVKSN